MLEVLEVKAASTTSSIYESNLLQLLPLQYQLSPVGRELLSSSTVCFWTLNWTLQLSPVGRELIVIIHESAPCDLQDTWDFHVSIPFTFHWTEGNLFQNKVVWSTEWLLHQAEFRLYHADSHGEDSALLCTFTGWDNGPAILCDIARYCAIAKCKFPVDRRSCERGEYLDVRSNRWQLGAANCQLWITVAPG